MSERCPWCEAPIAPGPKCPKCGAIYAKAEAIRLHGRASAPEDVPKVEEPAEEISPESLLVHGYDEPLLADPVLEWKFCLFALPTVLVLGVLFHAFSLGHFLQRTFLSMPLHESGHAVTAWLCGFASVPMLWVTHTAEDRGLLTPIIVAAAILYTTVRAIRAGNRGLMIAGFVLLGLQFIGTLLLKTNTAHALITFGGDAGAMIFGTLLMSTFFYGKQTQLYKGSLRWGFLVIGAASFVDTFSTWWTAMHDYTDIPVGEIEGVGLSDPARLLETYGWSQAALVHRYVGLGMLCLIALIVVWIWGIYQARQAMQSAKRPAPSNRR
jgi:hypothetical protein